MSGQVSIRVGLMEFTLDSKDGLLVELSSGDSSWASLQDARELLVFLQSNLEPDENARSHLRPFLDRSTT